MNPLQIPEIEMPGGVCHFVGTPIGNLADISLRALAVLQSADVIYAEDTRKTRRLLSHYGLSGGLVAYHDHNKERVVPQVLQRLEAGDRVAVVSDAGMPCVSDPGYTLIVALQAAGLPWTVIPGPSSTLAALVLSGFPTDRFLFLGYAPRKKGQRRAFLEAALEEQGTVLVLESCHRIGSTLEILAEIAPEREVAVAREITKLHEEALRGTAAQLLRQMTGPRLKGELVLVLKGRGRPERRARREA